MRPVRRVAIAIVTLVALAAEVGLAGVASAGATTAPAVVNAAGGACQAYTFPDAADEPVAFGSAVSPNTPTDVPIATYADRVTGLAADPATGGYWLVGANGGVFSYGTAPFYGSLPGVGVVPNAPVTSMAAAPTGHGYWEVARDGGIFAFGSARFYGSMGRKPLNAPVVGMAADSATGGYWLVGADGGVFAFTAPFYGSLAGKGPLTNPVASIASTPNGSGYWLLPTVPPVVPGVPVLGEPAPITRQHLSVQPLDFRSPVPLCQQCSYGVITCAMRTQRQDPGCGRRPTRVVPPARSQPAGGGPPWRRGGSGTLGPSVGRSCWVGRLRCSPLGWASSELRGSPARRKRRRHCRPSPRCPRRPRCLARH